VYAQDVDSERRRDPARRALGRVFGILVFALGMIVFVPARPAPAHVRPARVDVDERPRQSPPHLRPGATFPGRELTFG